MNEKIEIPESKEIDEKLVASKIYQFTHPDWDSAWSGESETRPRHRKLQELWGEKIREIGQDPTAVLFYVSAFSTKHFQALAKKNEGNLSLWEQQELKMAAAAIARDLERILEAKRLLGRRFILFTHKKITQDNRAGVLEAEKKRLDDIFKKKGLEIPPQLHINCFGEYKEKCVPNAAKTLAVLLGLDSKESYHVAEGLSLSEVDPESFYQNPPRYLVHMGKRIKLRWK